MYAKVHNTFPHRHCELVNVLRSIQLLWVETIELNQSVSNAKNIKSVLKFEKKWASKIIHQKFPLIMRKSANILALKPTLFFSFQTSIMKSTGLLSDSQHFGNNRYCFVRPVIGLESNTCVIRYGSALYTY